MQDYFMPKMPITDAVVVTNADRIRAMSDEELADVLRIDVCCPDGYIESCGSYDSCNECWVAWLQQPAEGE